MFESIEDLFASIYLLFSYLAVAGLSDKIKAIC